jgi:hypothetical protein
MFLTYPQGVHTRSSSCIMTKTIATEQVRRNNEKILLCDSGCKNVLKPNGLATKSNNTAKDDEIILLD